MNIKNSGSILFLLIISIISCTNNPGIKDGRTVRPPVDTIGFAHLGWQMDSVVSRINRIYPVYLNADGLHEHAAWKAAICPHDDYAYASWMYPAILSHIKAPTVIIFGVAHKARLLNLEDKLVFDGFASWHGPYGNVRISRLREKIIKNLSPEFYSINDSIQMLEHSVEALVPFLQFYNRNVKIISILVPYMNIKQMEEISNALSAAIFSVMKAENLKLGKDLALLITTDAVHYGDEEWGGKNYAPFGTDSAGYEKAMAFEYEILKSCFEGRLNDDKIRKFYEYTLNADNYKEYKWTWCGRYCVPLGLKTAEKLMVLTGNPPLFGQIVGYMNSIDHTELPVKDLRMGKTAIATPRHWVGYAAVGYD